MENKQLKDALEFYGFTRSQIDELIRCKKLDAPHGAYKLESSKLFFRSNSNREEEYSIQSLIDEMNQGVKLIGLDIAPIELLELLDKLNEEYGYKVVAIGDKIKLLAVLDLQEDKSNGVESVEYKSLRELVSMYIDAIENKLEYVSEAESIEYFEQQLEVLRMI